MLRSYEKRSRQEGPKQKVQEYWGRQVKHQQKHQEPQETTQGKRHAESALQTVSKGSTCEGSVSGCVTERSVRTGNTRAFVKESTWGSAGKYLQGRRDGGRWQNWVWGAWGKQGMGKQNMQTRGKEAEQCMWGQPPHTMDLLDRLDLK